MSYFKLQSILYVAVLTLISNNLLAQITDRYDFPFEENQTTLSFPNAGGFNNPIFSNVDLNNDDLADLYIFEYSDKTHHSFLQNEDTWEWTEDQCINFPEMESWAFLIDYNGDGASDIFTFAYENNPGILVYDGFWLDDKLAFKPQTFTENGYLQAVYELEDRYDYIFTSAGDLPAFGDVDNDGDIDIVLKSRSLEYFNLYRNLSVENGFNTDSLIFILDDDCWGKIKDDGSNGYVLSENPNECAGFYLKNNHSNLHGNSTQSLLDYNDDGLIDLFVADGGGSYVTLFINSGTAENTHFTQQHQMYPTYNQPINLNYMPALFSVDYNFDGYQDILVSPQLSLSENKKVVQLYQNTGIQDSLVLEFTEDNLFVNDILDFGTGSHPAVADVNGDGLLDVIIGNYGYFLPGGDRDARLILCLNTGTKTQPAFEITNEDWLGLSQLSAWYFTPTFADIDGDDDQDLIFGSNNGTLFHLENEAAPNLPMEFSHLDSAWMNIHSLEHPLGQRTTPAFYDLNKDGLLDLIVGERGSNLNYFQNIGTATEPLFNPDPNDQMNDNFLGKINVSKIGSSVGNSAPFFVQSKMGTKLLLASQELGVLQYQVSFLNDEPTFTLLPDTLLKPNFGFDLHTTAADFNNDGYLDIVCGNHRGGLSFFATPKTEEWQQDVMLTIYPLNIIPQNIYFSNRQLHINTSQIIEAIQIHNANGQIVYAVTPKANQLCIDFEYYPPGVYLGILSLDQKIQYFKISVN